VVPGLVELDCLILAGEAFRAFGIVADTLSDHSGRSRCHVVRATSAGVSYAVKLYPAEYTEDELLTEIGFAGHLHQRGMGAPRYRNFADGRPFLTLPGRARAAIYDWVEGDILTRLDRPRLALMVREIAANHEAARSLSIQRPDRWLWEDAIDSLRRCTPPEDLADWIATVVVRGRPWRHNSGLPICHNDYSTSNTVWETDGGRPIFIDFTNSINAPPEWDLATFCADLYLRSAYPGSILRLAIDIADAYAADDRRAPAIPPEFIESAVVQRGLFRALDPSEAPDVWRKMRHAQSF
jgi:Ser/Thr protein kinase RdoA (MazF antagonist)